MADSVWATLGQVTRTRGLKGELVVQPWSDKLAGLIQREEVFLCKKKPECFKVVSARSHQGKVFLKLEGIETLAQAEFWKGSLVQIPAERLPQLAEDEFYVHNLEGLAVFSEEDEYLGQIKEIITNPGNDIFSVLKDGKISYIPATKKAIKKVDSAQKKIIVNKNFVVDQ